MDIESNIKTAWDIEIVPDENKIALLPEPEVKLGNTRDPEKIAEKIKEAKDKQIEKMGINPLFGRVCSSAFFGDEQNEYKVIDKITDAEEIELLNYTFDNLLKSNIIITFNGMEFDFRYIYIRAAILKMELPMLYPQLSHWVKRYTIIPHCDLYKVLNNWAPYSSGSGMNLDTVGRVMLGSGKTDRNYSEYLDLLKNGKGDRIGRDNICDVEITYNLYKKLKGYLF